MLTGLGTVLAPWREPVMERALSLNQCMVHTWIAGTMSFMTF